VELSPIADACIPATVEVPVRKIHRQDVKSQADVLAVEEPLEIRLGFSQGGHWHHRAVSVTMRSPGHDFDLAAGFLFTEGIVASLEQIELIRHCGPRAVAGYQKIVRVDLRSDVAVDLARLERHFYTTSSCGICGKTSLDALWVCRRTIPDMERPGIDPEVIHRLSVRLRAAQAVFDRTGGLHAAGLFDSRGNLLSLREDVGRHNAVDKLIGAQLRAGNLPLQEHILLLSGRACFELVQKAMMAGVPVLAAVGAPSSLAVELARECGMTVLGFVRHGRFNVYTGADRIRAAARTEMEGGVAHV
jgi:FdhD protein